MKALSVLTLVAAVALGGCAAHRVEVPTPAPKSTQPKASPPPPRAAQPRVVAPGESAAPESTVPAAVPEAASVPSPQAGQAPSATESTYVFAPQQAAVASRPAGPAPAPGGSTVPPSAAAPRGQVPPAENPEGTPDAGPGRLQLSVVASAAEIQAGSIMTVDVMASSSHAVVDAPLHLTFDPNVVEFVDGAVGDFLAQGGSSVVFFADGQSRPGDVAVAAGRVERAQGASGAGLLCRLRFRGTASGTTQVAVGQAKAWGVDGKELIVSGNGANVIVR